MKKRICAICLSALLLSALLAGCGAESAADTAVKFNGATMSGNSFTGGGAPMAPSEEMDYYVDADMKAEYDYAYSESTSDSGASSGSLTGGQNGDRAETFDKIIYSGSASVETIEFEDTVDRVYALVDRYGGFLESAYVTGKDYQAQYYGYNSYRTADFIIRVPREVFSSLTGSLEELGSVTYSSVRAQNITSAYFDTQSRLDTYRTEESRLLAMLEKADTVEDMLNIESRLSDVRYHIESLTTTLTNWDSKISYSTLELNIREVRELTEETPIARTFGEDIPAGVRDSVDWLVDAFKDLVIFVASAIPVLILPAAVVVVLICLIRAKKRKKAAKAKQNDMQDND